MDIRFSITQKDGKLEKMMNKIPSTIKTEVIKEALRFYLRAVRDREIESDFLDAELLADFQSNISKKIDIEDMKQLLGARPVGSTIINTISEQPNNKVTENAQIEDTSSNNDYENNEYEDYEEEKEEDTTSNTFINVDIDEDDF